MKDTKNFISRNVKGSFTRRILKEHSKVTWWALGYSRHLDTQALEALRPSKGTSALGRSSYMGTWRLEGHLDTQIFKIPGDFFLKTHITYIYIHIYLQRRSDFALNITFEFENACHKKLKRTNIFSIILEGWLVTDVTPMYPPLI